jgi:pilus assembly protein FimV
MAVSHARNSRFILVLLSAAWANCSCAAGLGAVNLQSGLGEPLHANVQLFGAGTDELDGRCVKVRLESLEGATVMTPLVTIKHADAGSSIRLGTRQPVNEPALNVVVRIDCGATQVRRDYQILLDPVPTTARAAARQAQPVRLAAEPARIELAEAVAAMPPKTAPRRDATSRRPPTTPKRKQARHHHPATPKSHPVLRLSAAGMGSAEPEGILQLRLADRLMPGTATPDNPNMGAPQAAARPDATQDEDRKNMQALMNDLHAEAVALRAEAARMKQQNLAYRNELDSTHDESLNWIKGLAGLLAVCFAAVGWLLWRVFTMKQAGAQTWHDPFTELRTETPDTEYREGHTQSMAPESGADETDEEFLTAPKAAAAQQDACEETADEFEADVQTAPSSKRSEVPAIDETAARTPVAPHPVFRAAQEGAAHASAEPEHLLKAEEISDVMELVDAWMTLNAPDKVLELLRPFNDVEQPESPLPWLCLLDVYRAIGDQKKYEAILLRIKTLFNVKLTPWGTQSSHESPKTLADFPHVIEEIADLWHTSAIVPYLESLLHDDRNGTRHGFDLPAYRDILQLTTLANEPGRLKRDDQTIPDQARAILSGVRGQAQANASTLSIDEMKSTSPDATITAMKKAYIRERPKYITTSYERAVALRQRVKTRASVAATTTSDLPPDPVGIVPPHQTAPAASEQLDAIITDDLSPIAIKLHLAVAYQDIGDNEGACLLLDEVIHDGNEEQAQQAKQMLAKLA